MGQYSKLAIETFLKNQLQLFPEVVAETYEEAEEFLDICMAMECDNMKEVKAYFKEVGDISGMTTKELEEQSEVFKLPNGKYLVVDA